MQCEELQKRVWDMPDYHEVVPANLLITAIKNGGLLVGAFANAQMLGFAFGFLGSETVNGTRRLKHTSHMLAVVREAQGHGVGARLKWFQRDEALKQGLDLMTWTFDPLQAGNAHLNLARLGAIARRYFRNAYGEMTDALNAGIASDRFEVEWFLTSPRVAARATETRQTEEMKHLPRVYTIEWTADALPRIVSERPLEGETLLVEIPANLYTVKRRNLPLAIEWREKTRASLERAFEMGYAATDFFNATDAQGRAQSFYVLELMH